MALFIVLNHKPIFPWKNQDKQSTMRIFLFSTIIHEIPAKEFRQTKLLTANWAKEGFHALLI